MRQLFRAASCNHKCGSSSSSNIIFLEKTKWVGREATEEDCSLKVPRPGRRDAWDLGEGASQERGEI